MFLYEHQQRPIFRLEPHICIPDGSRRWVLDTKWKLLDASNRTDKYGRSQADFYQLYAYGQKYLDGLERHSPIDRRWKAGSEVQRTSDPGNDQ